jgi:hypothetical protein
MKELIPLLQTLVWPAFWASLIVFGRKPILGILQAVRDRVEAGDTLKAPWFELTSSVKMPVGRSKTISELEESDQDEEEETGEEEEDNPGFYIVHKARRDRSLDKEDYEYYRIRVFLEWDPGVDETQIQKVVYHFPEGFLHSNPEVKSRETQFEFRTAAWGQFNLTADIYLRGREDTLKLERYLNF